MIRPHEIADKTVHDVAAQERYEAHIDQCLSVHDFAVQPDLFIYTPKGLSLADRTVVLAKYTASYELVHGGTCRSGWTVRASPTSSGVIFELPPS